MLTGPPPKFHGTWDILPHRRGADTAGTQPPAGDQDT